MPLYAHKLEKTAAPLVLIALLLAGLALTAGCDNDEAPPPQDGSPLKLGLILNFTDSPEASASRKQAFDLAIKHVNQGGGVLGQPVEGISADATGQPDVALREARRLVESHGVHAIVGPNASSAAVPIAKELSGPSHIPTISSSATSPLLTEADDNDFFFRTVLSDSAQGPVLARVTRERGFDNIGLIYQDDAWGRGLAATFQESWTGKVQSVAVGSSEETYLPALRKTAEKGAQALVVVASEVVALPIVREAVANNIYSNFTFGDAAKRPSLVKEIGGEHLGGMYGTAGVPAPENESANAWNDAFIREYGALSPLPYVKETYDATIALAFAAQAAGSVDGASIRDQLRSIGGSPGQTILASPSGIADALRLLSEGTEIDYQGAAVSLDWDRNGDLRRGYIGVWRFTPNEDIEELESILFEY